MRFPKGLSVFDNMISKRPIIICGQPRSGTTLLQNIISSHPDVEIIKRDQPWWGTFYKSNRYNNLENDPKVLKLLLDDIFNSPTLQKLPIAIERHKVEAKLNGLKSTKFGQVFAAVSETYAESHGKPRWGLKTPGLELYADAIFDAYPDALMIQLIRDPRDVYVSRMAKIKWQRDVIVHILDWNKSVRYSVRNLRKYPDSYWVMRFEDLLLNQQKSIKKIYDFLKLKDTINYKESNFSPNSSFTDVSDIGISTNPIRRYKLKIPILDHAVCNIVGMKYLRKYSYELDTNDIPYNIIIQAVVRILFRIPVHVLRSIKLLMKIKLGLHDKATVWIKRTKSDI